MDILLFDLFCSSNVDYFFFIGSVLFNIFAGGIESSFFFFLPSYTLRVNGIVKIQDFTERRPLKQLCTQ